jgi:hypothetical protein
MLAMSYFGIPQTIKVADKLSCIPTTKQAAKPAFK